MAGRSQITSIIPKKYRENASILEVTSLSELEKSIKKLNEQVSAVWFITSLAIYSVVYDGELYSESGLRWKDYRKQTRDRFGMDHQEFSEALSAGKFIAEYGKELFAAGWKPERSMRKLARANLALSVCGDPTLVIDHLVNDQWIEFKAWYGGLKQKLIPGPDKKPGSSKNRVIEFKRGKVFVNGVEPVVIAEGIPAGDRKEIEKLIAEYYRAKT